MSLDAGFFLVFMVSHDILKGILLYLNIAEMEDFYNVQKHNLSSYLLVKAVCVTNTRRRGLNGSEKKHHGDI